MKILTNVQSSSSGGIFQTFSSFLGFLERRGKTNVTITGIDIQPKINFSRKNLEKSRGIFTLITAFCEVPDIHKVTKISKSLKDIENFYSDVIEIYQQIILQKKPDLILLNGTYFLPWCLLIASRNLNVPMILHYHGILTKEVAQWDKKSRLLLNQMEKDFDLKKIFYVFPSKLSKMVVESEVFGHKIKKYLVLSNPVQRHFFNSKKKRNSKNMGIVSRWAEVKNFPFVGKIAAYNYKQGNEFSIEVVTNLNKMSREYKKGLDLVKLQTTMTNQELAEFYTQMGVVVSPSLFETYGNVAQESLASNTPALVNSQMGVAETFKELGLKDWIVDFSSVQDVFDKAKEIRHQEVSPKIRKILYEEYSPDKIHGQLLSLIKSA